MALPVGTQAPDFTLISTALRHFNLYDDVDGQLCILHFYDQDFNLSTQYDLGILEDHHQLLKTNDIALVAVGKNSLVSHQMLKRRLKLSFDLLADEQGQVSNIYQVKQKLLSFQAKRVTYLLNSKFQILDAHENLFSSSVKSARFFSDLVQLSQRELRVAV